MVDDHLAVNDDLSSRVPDNRVAAHYLVSDCTGASLCKHSSNHVAGWVVQDGIQPAFEATSRAPNVHLTCT
jgi:hypothetical protein